MMQPHVRFAACVHCGHSADIISHLIGSCNTKMGVFAIFLIEIQRIFCVQNVAEEKSKILPLMRRGEEQNNAIIRSRDGGGGKGCHP